MKSLRSCFYRVAARTGRVDLNKTLLGVVAGGGTRKAEAVIDAGADVHYQHDAALRMAQTRGYTETEKVLLNVGAYAHARRDYPLIEAAKKGDTKKVKDLLASGEVDPHAWEDGALCVAAANGRINTVAALLEVTTDTKAVEKARQLAVEHGHDGTRYAGGNFYTDTAGVLKNWMESGKVREDLVAVAGVAKLRIMQSHDERHAPEP